MYLVFDLLYLNREDLMGLPLVRRPEILKISPSTFELHEMPVHHKAQDYPVESMSEPEISTTHGRQPSKRPKQSFIVRARPTPPGAWSVGGRQRNRQLGASVARRLRT